MDPEDDPYYVDLPVRAPRPSMASHQGSSILLESADIFFDVLRKQQRQLELLSDAVRIQAAMRRRTQQQQHQPMPPPVPIAAVLRQPPPPMTSSPPIVANQGGSVESSARRLRGPRKPLADMFAAAPVGGRSSLHYRPSPPPAPVRKVVAGKRQGSATRVRTMTKRSPPPVSPALVRKKRVGSGGVRKKVVSAAPSAVKLRLPPPPLEIDDGRVLSHKERIELLRLRWRTEQQYRAEGGATEEVLQVDVTGARLRQSSVVAPPLPTPRREAHSHRGEELEHVTPASSTVHGEAQRTERLPSSDVNLQPSDDTILRQVAEAPAVLPEVRASIDSSRGTIDANASALPIILPQGSSSPGGGHHRHVPRKPSPRPLSVSPSRRGTDEEAAKLAEKLFLERLKIEEESPGRRRRAPNNAAKAREAEGRPS